MCQRVVGGMVWNPVLQRSFSSEHLETKSLPSRSPPTTPNWYDLQRYNPDIILPKASAALRNKSIFSFLFLNSVRYLQVIKSTDFSFLKKVILKSIELHILDVFFTLVINSKLIDSLNLRIFSTTMNFFLYTEEQ